MELDLFVGHFILLGQNTTTNLKSLSVSHSLVLSGSLHQNMMPINGSDVLHLHDIAHLVKTQNLIASNALTFSMITQPRVSIENIGHSLWLWQTLKNEAGGADSALVLSQTVTVTASKGTNNTLALSHVATVSSVTRNFLIEDILSLEHGMSMYMPKRGYSQFFIPAPTLQDVNFFLAGVVNETFRPPLFGNQDELAFQRINRRSRGGDLTIFRDSEWPMTETLHLNFDFPNQSSADRLINVLRQTIGQYVQYTDHEATAWLGIIKNPDAPRIQAGRNTFNIEVVMEVEKVPTLNALIVDELSLTQSVRVGSVGGSSLAVSQSLQMNFTRSFTVSHELALTHHILEDRVVHHTLSILDFASCLNPLMPLALTQDLGVSGTYKRAPISGLALAQTVDVSVTISESVSDTLEFQSYISGLNDHEFPQTHLHLTQKVHVAVRVPFHLSVSDNLTFTRGSGPDGASWLNPIQHLGLFGYVPSVDNGDNHYLYTPLHLTQMVEFTNSNLASAIQSSITPFDTGITNTSALSADTVPGNLLIAFVAMGGETSSTTVAVTGFTQVGTSAKAQNTFGPDYNSISMWKRIVTSGADKTVIATATDPVTMVVSLLEYSGRATVDGVASAFDRTFVSSWSPGLITVTGANDLVIAGFADPSVDMTGSFTPDGTFSVALSNPDGGGTGALAVFITQKLASSSDEDPSATITGGDQPFVSVGASFKS